MSLSRESVLNGADLLKVPLLKSPIEGPTGTELCGNDFSIIYKFIKQMNKYT